MPAITLTRFLETATRSAAALARLHRQNIIHQNIRPQNLRIDPATGDVELLGAATDVSRTLGGGILEQTVSWEGLPYASPEQTGRANRPIDQRSDLYSLGVTLYEMLAGCPPFHAEDALGWVHCHLAVPPRPLEEAAPGTPRVVSDIFAKVLAKAPEERYQSARGLERDLARCLADLESSGRVEPFPLGAQDVGAELRLSGRIYGRDKELATLFAAFERVVTTGTPGLALISGYSGIGKSSLVQELHRPIVRERGFFIEGKFDQYKRDIPYFTIGQAFRELIRQLLGESEERIAEWRARLREALGPNGRLIAEVLPQIELVLGELPPVPPLPSAEAQIRFNTVFQSFIGVFATREHPLVLFLDDLQWLDFGSLNLLQHLLTQPGEQHLLVLGAYRDNEVDASHPLVPALAELRKSGLPIVELTLGPLAEEHLVELVAGALRCPRDDAAPLAELLAAKTAGNPFFVTQFMQELHHEGLLWFSADDAAWRWDLAAIEAKAYTDNIVDLIVGKLRRLPAETQRALELAASIGNEFALDALAAILDEAPEQARDRLAPAFAAGVVLRRGSLGKFLHDRVQQAAYALIPEEERAGVHLRVGRLFLARMDEVELGERLFDVVNQLNLGTALVSDPEERKRMGELNLLAGRKAKAAAAHRSGAAYLSAGLAMLGDEAWETDQPLLFALHHELAECQIVSGDVDEAQRHCAALHAGARTKLDRAAAYRLEMQIHTTKGEHGRGVEIGIECLGMLGLELPLHPGTARVEAALQEIDEILTDRRIEDLLDSPCATDPEVIAVLETLTDLYIAAAFWTDSDLVNLTICSIVRTSIEHGNTGASTLGYVLFGAYLKAPRGEFQDAYRFGKLSLELIDKHAFTTYKAQVYNVNGSMILHWSRHFREVIRCIRTGIEAGIETGAAMYKCFNSVQEAVALLLNGSPLDEVLVSTSRSINFLAGNKLGFLLPAPMSIRHLARCMQGSSPSISSFNGDDLDEVAYEEELLRSGVGVPTFYYFTTKLIARFIAGENADALATAAIADSMKHHCDQHMIAPEYYFFSALATAGALASTATENRAELEEALRAHEEKLRLWATSNPDNYLGKHRLVSAEIARLEGRGEDAAKLYDQAVRAFRASGFIHYEGIAGELAARFYIDRGFLTIPEAYLREAMACYARWGAHGKVRQLQWLYPGLIASQPSAPLPHQPATAAEDLDTVTAVKASRALSHETAPDRLLAALMRIVIEHASAQRCCLLLPRSAGMDVIAEAEAGSQGIAVQIAPSGQALPSAGVPATIMNYVRRTREKVVLADASADSAFASDAYLSSARPRSVLCMPIVRHGSLEGVLYLENRLAAGAFTPRRLALLEFLGAVSLENASLYTQLERESEGRKQAERTLLESEERLRRLVETANLIPWEADVAAGRLTYLGPQAAAVLGYRGEAWKEQPAADFLGMCVHPQDRDQALASFFRAGDRGDNLDFRAVAADGRTLWLHNVVSAPRNVDGRTAVSGFLVDITDRKEIEARLQEQLYTIQRQQEDIRRLSTPIIEVWEGVLTMPVLGAIDNDRAQQMMDVILDAVSRKGCRATIIDLTGVDTVDTGTANHIIRIVRAVQLLGSRGIVVGIRPEVAQTMVSIGVELSAIVTLANLREALLLCMRLGKSL